MRTDPRAVIDDVRKALFGATDWMGRMRTLFQRPTASDDAPPVAARVERSRPSVRPSLRPSVLPAEVEEARMWEEIARFVSEGGATLPGDGT